MIIRLFVLSFLALAGGCASALSMAENGGSAPATASRHMVSAANPLAAEAGRGILRAGGSATDAAIATALVLTLVEPQSSGIGGGGFLIHYAAASRTVEAYDGRETAPRTATTDMFRGMGFKDAVPGGLSVGVPGLLRLFEMAHRDHGRLPWKRLFDPAIRLAEDGFDISPRLHSMISSAWALNSFEASRRYFFTDDGAPKPMGARLRNPALAKTLRRVADEGADAFYKGPIAEAMVAAVRNAPRNPGRMSMADMAAYRAVKRRPVCGAYRVWRVCGMPPPSSGGVAVLQILGVLAHFPLPDMEPASPRAVHLFAEAGKLAFADRKAHLADPDAVRVPVERLLDPVYLKRRAGRIGERALPAPVPSGIKGESTSHLSVVDKDGNAVSLTASIESAFGSRLMAGGFLLNNELTDFSAPPNAPGPGKRPLSSMSPTIVLDRDGRFAMAVGSPGGPRIIGYVAKALVAALDWGLDAQQSIDLANFQSRGGALELEAGTGLETMAAKLEAMGHQVNIKSMTSGLHAIRARAGALEGGADPRREGAALGD